MPTKNTIGFYTSQADESDSGPGMRQSYMAENLSKVLENGIELVFLHYSNSDENFYNKEYEITIPQPRILKWANKIFRRDISLNHQNNFISEIFLSNNYDIDLIHFQGIPYKRLYWLSNYDGKVVSTIHSPWDLVTERPWTNTSSINHIKLDLVKQNLFKMLVRQLDAIITVSKYMKEKLIRVFNIPESKITVIYNAAPSRNHQQDVGRKIQSMYNIDNRYIFHVSHLGPRKNPKGVVRGFEIAREKFGLTQDLVIAGSGWSEGTVREYLHDPNTIENIKTIGYVQRKHLIRLHTHADCFLFPSYLESCSFAQLESMTHGNPVLTTDSGGLREVGAESNVYITDPEDYQQIAEKLMYIIENNRKYGFLGKQRARYFSWEKAAKKTVDVYCDVLQERTH